FRAHVHEAFEAEQSADRGSRDTMLPGAGFGNYAMLAHALDQQSLAQAVVDFMSASVKQVFALQIYLRSAQLFGEAACIEESRWPTGIGLQKTVQTCLELGIALRLLVFAFELIERAHQSLRNVATAPRAKAPGLDDQRGLACGRRALGSVRYG